MNYEKKKNSVLGVIASNPVLAKQMREAWFAKPGSTKRAQARATIRSINKIGQRLGVYDGRGGSGDATSTSALYNPNTTSYGSTTPVMGTTTPQFANPKSTGTTAPRTTQLGTYDSSAMKPQEFGTYASRYIKEIPGMVKDQFPFGPWTMPKDIATKLGAEALEKFGVKTKKGDQSFMQSVSFLRNIDNVFKPYEGIGEVLVNEMFKSMTGKDAPYTERLKLANKSAKEVREYIQNILNLKVQNEPVTGTSRAFPADQTTATEQTQGATGTTPGTAAVGTESPEVTAKKQEITSITENLVNMLTMDREKYLKGLDENTRAGAEKILKYIDAGFTQDMAVSQVMGDLEIMRKLFPGMPVDKLPIGAFLEEATVGIEEAIDKRYKIQEQRDNMYSMQSRGLTLENDFADYIKAQDTYLLTIDKLMDKTLDFKYQGRQLTGTEQRQTDSYLNFLETMKGKQQARYIDWLDKAVKEYDASYQRALLTYEKTSADATKELTKQEALTTARYNTLKTYLNGMYDQLAVMSTNSYLSSKAKQSQWETANTMVENISKLKKSVKGTFSTEEATNILNKLGISDASDDLDKTGIDMSDSILNTIDTSTFSSEVPDMQKLYGTFDGETMTALNEDGYNLYNVFESAIKNKIEPNATMKQWMADVGSSIYSSALGDYSLDELVKYEQAMDELKYSSDYATNPDKELAWQNMNNTIYAAYMNGIKAKLTDPANSGEAEEIAKYIQALSKLSYTDIVVDGSVNPGAKEMALKASGADIDPVLAEEIWKYFSYWVNPPVEVYGFNTIERIDPMDVFLSNGETAKIIDDVLGKLLYSYESAHISEDYGKQYNGINSMANITSDDSTMTSTPAMIK